MNQTAGLTGFQKIGEALIAAKKNFAAVAKNAVNPHFNSKYADLQTVLDAVEPALLEQGLLLLQPVGVNEQGQRELNTVIVHPASGEVVSAIWTLPDLADPQKLGSALTYARRYSIMALLGLAPEDDDGSAAARPERPATPARDWLAELASVTTSQQAKDLGRAASAVGEFKQHEQVFRARVAELEAAEAAPLDAKGTPEADPPRPSQG